MMSNTSAPAAPSRLVVMVVYPGIAPLDLSGPLEAFAVANFVARTQLYDIRTASRDLAPIATSLGFSITPGLCLDDLEGPLDTLLVCGGSSPDILPDTQTLAWLRQARVRARRFGSICTGAFSLGAAGLLDGHRVTTHWAFSDLLAQRHPTAHVEHGVMHVRSGNMYSSGGIAAGIDLALALIEEDHGRALAQEVARVMVIAFRRSGTEQQVSGVLRSQASSIPAIQQVQSFCLANPDGDLRISSLAQLAKMSERNFSRVFQRETGQSPRDFVTGTRLAFACSLLSTTDLPVKTIAQRSGFGTNAALRREFRNRIGTTPAGYREQGMATAPIAGTETSGILSAS